MKTQAEQRPMVSLKDFFETVPPGTEVLVAGVQETGRSQGASVNSMTKEYKLDLPELLLHCDTTICNGSRVFSPIAGDRKQSFVGCDIFAVFRCQNCQEGYKTYAIRWSINLDENSLEKYGEMPAFGPPTPPRLKALFGDEWKYFQKGRRSESQGLGIGAFGYYRRVVENRKTSIIDEIIRVSRAVGASNELLGELAHARNETQFSKAVKAIKHGLPQVLLINGHNPLTLLHDALSEGLHGHTDEECLDFAHSIRIVLAEFVERAATALKDEQELTQAIGRLLKKKSGLGDQGGS